MGWFRRVRLLLAAVGTAVDLAVGVIYVVRPDGVPAAGAALVVPFAGAFVGFFLALPDLIALHGSSRSAPVEPPPGATVFERYDAQVLASRERYDTVMGRLPDLFTGLALLAFVGYALLGISGFVVLRGTPVIIGGHYFIDEKTAVVPVSRSLYEQQFAGPVRLGIALIGVALLLEAGVTLAAARPRRPAAPRPPRTAPGWLSPTG